MNNMYMMTSLKNIVEVADPLTICQVVIDEEDDFSNWHQYGLSDFVEELLNGTWDLKNMSAYLLDYRYSVPNDTFPMLTIHL